MAAACGETEIITELETAGGGDSWETDFAERPAEDSPAPSTEEETKVDVLDPAVTVADLLSDFVSVSVLVCARSTARDNSGIMNNCCKTEFK